MNNAIETVLPKVLSAHNLDGLKQHTSRVVGNLRRPPKTCHSSSESWENGDSEYVIRYAGKIRPFLKFQYLHTIRNPIGTSPEAQMYPETRADLGRSSRPLVTRGEFCGSAV